jgi:hypothetical protein
VIEQLSTHGAEQPCEGVGEKSERQTRITATAIEDAGLRQIPLFRSCARLSA